VLTRLLSCAAPQGAPVAGVSFNALCNPELSSGWGVSVIDVQEKLLVRRLHTHWTHVAICRRPQPCTRALFSHPPGRAVICYARTQYKLQIPSMAAIADLISTTPGSLSEKSWEKRESKIRRSSTTRGRRVPQRCPSLSRSARYSVRSIIARTQKATVGHWQPRMELDENHTLGFFLLEVPQHTAPQPCEIHGRRAPSWRACF
jgi:hypothetical protein